MNEPVNFILLGEVRTGGTVLADSLSRHSRLTVSGEILDFGPSDYWKQRRLPMVARLYADRTDVNPQSNLVPLLNQILTEYNGFVLHRQWQIAESNPAWAYLAARRGLKVIHLHRENVWRQYVSEQLAKASAVWHLERPDQPRPAWQPIAIDLAHCLHTMRERRRFLHWGQALFAERPAVTLRYEDIEADIGGVLSYCQGFLGVPRENLPVTHRKLTNRPPSQLVANFEAIRAALRGTEFEPLTAE
jgi:LPS sulfotransferase NodH